jgi:hypothetical protein
MSAPLLLVLVLLVVGASPAAAATPTVTINPTPTAGYSTAQVSGEIDPGTQEVAFYAEYRLAGSADPWTEQFVESVAAGSGPTPVSAEFTGLAAGTEYETRLDAFSNETLFLSPEPNPTFTTQAVTAPTVSMEPAGAVTATAAHFSGQINPNAPEAEPTSADVEGGFAVKWHFECTPECPGLSGGIVAADNSAHEVEADTTGLLPGTTYEVSLIGENAGGAATRAGAGPISFTTPSVAPVVSGSTTKQVSATEAVLSAQVNPGGAPTTYRFEYGTGTTYSQSTPVSAPIGADNEPHEVSARIEGLAPGTTYHWRAVATNSVTTFGPDQTFTTFLAAPVGGLPDGRVYEQVTPVDKYGAEAQGRLDVVQAALDGSAIAFFEQSAFPGSEGAQDFGSYLATRGTEGWSTQGLLPSPTTGPAGAVYGKSEDLKYSYVTNGSPAIGFTFYQRDNATRQLTPIARFGAIPHVVATSSDDSKLLFEAKAQLVPGAAEGMNLYLWDRASGTIHLAGALNAGTPEGEAPEEGAVAGPYAWAEQETSGGGTGGGYYTTNALAKNGESAYFTALGTGQLYLRRNLLAAQSQLNGQGECTEPQAACTVEVSESQAATPDPEGEKPAAYLAASSEGPPVVFFRSAEKLTDDATTGPEDEGADLYRYEAETGVLTDLVPDGTDPNGAEVQGVLGASADGSRVYFVANGVLGDGVAKGAVPGTCVVTVSATSSRTCNLYLWERGGGITFISELEQNGGAEESSDFADWEPSEAGGQVARTARISADGKTLVFRSRSKLTGYENEGVPEFYRYQVGGEVQCITCNPTGAAPVAAPTLFSIKNTLSGIQNQPPVLTRNLSRTGDRFFFESADKLVPGDTNGDVSCPLLIQAEIGVLDLPACQDVYEWEASDPSNASDTCTTASPSYGSSSGGCLYLISTGTSPEPSFLADVDLEGNNAFFYTGQQLVGQDRDSLLDIYDARVGGGIASQNPPPPNPCLEQASCKGPTPAPPSDATPGSAGFSETQTKPPLKCRRGFKKAKRHGKSICVKRGDHKRRHHHKRSHHERSHHKSGGSK